MLSVHINLNLKHICEIVLTRFGWDSLYLVKKFTYEWAEKPDIREFHQHICKYSLICVHSISINKTYSFQIMLYTCQRNITFK